MRNVWNNLREANWFAVIALVCLVIALSLALWTSLGNVMIVFLGAAVTSAVFSLRQ